MNTVLLLKSLTNNVVVKKKKKWKKHFEDVINIERANGKRIKKYCIQ